VVTVTATIFGSGLERYQGGSGELGELVSTISRLSAEVTALRVTQETQAKDNDSRHTATENKLKTVESTVANIEKTMSSNALKIILRNIRDDANKLQAMKRELTIYNRQLTEACQAGLSDRRMELQGKIEIADNQIQSLQQTLAGLREDAKEQAEQDALVLTDAQLRNDA
jgi:predicted  nucleic acid-binding Zn-ribbon protein